MCGWFAVAYPSLWSQLFQGLQRKPALWPRHTFRGVSSLCPVLDTHTVWYVARKSILHTHLAIFLEEQCQPGTMDVISTVGEVYWWGHQPLCLSRHTITTGELSSSICGDQAMGTAKIRTQYLWVQSPHRHALIACLNYLELRLPPRASCPDACPPKVCPWTFGPRANPSAGIHQGIRPEVAVSIPMTSAAGR